MATEHLAAPPRLAPRYLAALLPRRRRDGTVGGRELVLDEVTVDPDRLADYCRLCGFALDGTLPTTYPQVLAFPLQLALMTEPGFPFRLPGLVHLRQRVAQRRRIEQGRPLTLRVRAEPPRAHRRGARFDLVSELAASGETAWTGRGTYLARGATAPGGNSDDPEPREVRSEHPAARWRVASDTGRRYARVSGDVNPIHLHPLSARPLGFPGAVAHGMWTAARCVASVAGRLPEAHTLDAVFRSPVALPSTVELALAAVTDGWDLTLRPKHGRRPHLVASLRHA
ncbi:MaoC family dehydratase [Pseudonocardia acaciae]|uniref:MaoC family dehydratase n=1 Tax=Pseudonocardia acaciae TaxID=551276 RepID=UPI0004914CC2|nr:MaoC/PaaZ C-terminal domain-containing protein [Pseudonocardia acaciae]